MSRATNERGVALISAILVLMMMSAMLTGFMVMINADQVAGGVNRDQTQAYAAAHAGVEKLTADLGQLFNGTFSPTGTQLDELTTADKEPDLPGISYVRPNGSSGYQITFTDDDGDGNPDVADPNGTPIGAGPYQGLVGLITPYQVDVTARTSGGAEVKMRRTMQTIAIPVFQFGIFSENDLSFFAGPNFAFGGRVHTNQHLFLKQDSGNTLTLQNPVTAVGEVIRTYLANGKSGTHTATVRVARAPGCPAAPTAANGSCFNLLDTQSSVVDKGSLSATLAAAQADKANDTTSALNPVWTTVSMGTSNGWLRNWRTGAKRLDLPIVSDGASPVDLIRRPPVGESATSAVGRQRFYNMATLRILLSDQPDDITSLPGVVFTAGTTPLRLAGTFTPESVTGGLSGAQAFAASEGNRNGGHRTVAGTPTIDGYILINRQDRNGTWTDVTMEVLSLGFSGRRLSNGTIDVADLDNECVDVHPNAIIRLQRVKDTLTGGNACPSSATGFTPPGNSTDYWPNVLYDPREGMLRDDPNLRRTAPSSFGTAPNNVVSGQQRLYWAGVMHYVELDVHNLRRWLRGEIGSSNDSACIDGAGPDTCAMDVTGFVVYFSDRRGNRNLGSDNAVEQVYSDTAGFTYSDDLETGEFGFEDIINPASSSSVPNGVLDGPFVDAEGNNRYAEDVNNNGGAPDTYGGYARLLPTAKMISVVGFSNRTPANDEYELFDPNHTIDRNVARVNRAFFFRRALKLVNGGRGQLPANGTQGLTVASENPVYVQGNFNACTSATPTISNNFQPSCAGSVGFGDEPGTDHVSAAVIADAVTFLSNAWNDIRSFVNPHTSGTSGLTHKDAQNKYDARQAVTTWFRLGIIAGKGLNFARPTSNDANDHADFGTDGGAHNFIRYIENWDNATLNYRGSLISFYTSRQAVGTYKCCDIVYTAPGRGYKFDEEFLNPNLLPPRTPMFRDVNTLTFRQILRPTQ